MGRGFLPRGLSNTCPQVSAARDTVAVHGQVSNKPKHVMTASISTGCVDGNRTAKRKVR
jgi:hypothetical protein